MRSWLEQAIEAMRQANERMDEHEKEFETNQRELKTIIVRIAAINFYVETNL
ncbi:MAG TPA: hypothetical protein PLD20_16190 [Blastocatellia bacterium]|nr:hypothetical protein [Blastocatellia bacterium]HMV86775.1 hypothetical protein [Blastocatellia bacterium]HMX25431.1 hypothetical protein [Blastocatellia bacterium]HMY71176.1 hypothetical protein [Blastocatellia bacterium]HMZ19479.1 hypothetical protein [Blastocatellia bacterium]